MTSPAPLRLFRCGSLVFAPPDRAYPARMALNDTVATEREKPHKIGDTGGLFLLVPPSAGKLWRLKHRALGKERRSRSTHTLALTSQKRASGGTMPSGPRRAPGTPSRAPDAGPGALTCLVTGDCTVPELAVA